jgi:nitrite reductase/ring-hydroxylating ferredoxin subunit
MITYPTRFPVRVILILAFIVFFGISCKKENPPPEIPYVYVNFAINPNSTQYLRLNSVNGWETLTGGYKGILVFRRSPNEFSAFERACPYDPTVTGSQVRVDTSGVTCYCPVCKSKYIMVDGTPYEGVSHYPLKQYTTNYDGNLLYISN